MFWKINHFIQAFLKKKGPFKTVLDVGSRNINGTSKDSFREAGVTYESYCGVDFIDGPNVDVVLNGHDVEKHFGQESFDLVISTETLEHDDEFWKTVEAMRNVTKPGGWMLITVPGPYFFLHDYPGDYYRFTEQAVRKFYDGWEEVHVEVFEDTNQKDLGDQKPNMSVLAYGRKPRI